MKDRFYENIPHHQIQDLCHGNAMPRACIPCQYFELCREADDRSELPVHEGRCEYFLDYRRNMSNLERLEDASEVMHTDLA